MNPEIKSEVEADASARIRLWEYVVDKAVLISLFAGWYSASIVFNYYNKQALRALPLPMTMTALQFGVGTIISLLSWGIGMVQRPKLTLELLKAVSVLASVHTLGNLFTNMSLGAVSVAFTHTIKAMEPFFSVVLSMMFLGEVPNPAVLATLVPIVGGVALASISEASFNWLGFLSAMGSNITFQSRNVLSKKLMLSESNHVGKAGSGEDTAGLGAINMFALITIASFIMLAPFSLALEGWMLLPSGLTLKGIVNQNVVIQQALIAAVSFHTYQQVSYMILSRVSPVTHSVGNCVKRVVVIVAAIILFSTPVSTQNALGTSIALGGVFAYGQVKQSKPTVAEDQYEESKQTELTSKQNEASCTL